MRRYSHLATAAVPKISVRGSSSRQLCDLFPDVTSLPLARGALLANCVRCLARTLQLSPFRSMVEECAELYEPLVDAPVCCVRISSA